MEGIETGATVYQVWEAPTARDMGGLVRTLHDAWGCSLRWCPFPLWIGLTQRCPPEQPKQGLEAPLKTWNSLSQANVQRVMALFGTGAECNLGKKPIFKGKKLCPYLWKLDGSLCGAPAAAKSLQSRLTLCNPINGSPPGSPVPGILQARTLEWVAISFSKAWKWKVKVKSLSHGRLLATPWTAAHQASPSMEFSRQEHWSGVPLPSPYVVVYGKGCVLWHATNLWFYCRFRTIWKHWGLCGWSVNAAKILIERVNLATVGVFQVLNKNPQG